MTKNRRKRREFDTSFKLEVVRMVKELDVDSTISATAQRLTFETGRLIVLGTEQFEALPLQSAQRFQ